MLTESLLLSGIGGACGLVIARWGQPLLETVSAQAGPIDWRVLGFVITMSTLTGIVFGIAPALRATRTNLNDAFKKSARTVAGSSRMGKALVIAQVTISLVLLIGAGLFLRTVQNLRRVEIGFNPQNVLLFRVSPALNGYEPAKRNPLYVDIGNRLRAIPGVRSVAWSNPALMAGRRFRSGIFIQGRAYPDRRGNDVSGASVSPDFFTTMEIPLAEGRHFTEHDTADAPAVAIINETAARLYFPHQSPIGRRFGITVEESGKIEIVGVLRDTKYNNIREPAPPTIFRPYQQSYAGTMTFEVRTLGDPLAVLPAAREAVRAADPNVPMIGVTTQLEEVENRFRQERLFAQAGTLFGALALFVAGVGLFGLMSYSVARRTHEIGLRMALGAERRDVLGLIMRESMILVAVGVVVGVGVALSVSQFVATLLFGLAPTDVMTIGLAIGLMVPVSAMAGYLPARRASRVDPMVALRYE
jgi:predicted permease